MSETDSAFVRSWSVVRERGKKTYIVNRGILKYGMTTAILCLAMTAMWSNYENDLSIFSLQGFVALRMTEIVLSFLIIGVLGGIAWGAATWAFYEWYYNAKASKNS